ncbi:STAS domain-containing protein [Pseudomonas gingeri]|uniref:STAS domain-containing protein n=1 Tax=Pseudomonas gingeri TaxID=117681 RepID=A0A7Y7YFY8_9PSED|nr:STAS domain-containing protein [Pseudomonas gingeri]NWB31343.1 STAS domain-containing protein [Pseudomonas gingeri]NWC35792.1 STAS domain-containing protein [Pseudomonas gingeri]NWD06328.1 STAS domain-containing protein [Pseudomonas gingeri]NWE32833.1 STAS domain-containing protein [Pseudomonas gingeri]NWE60446.1 STAS domain-containing protein [Pseudomonas gingeri]
MQQTLPCVRRILVLEGPLTIYTASERQNLLLELFPLAEEVEMDLGSVDELDTAGLQLLVLAKQESIRQGRTLILSNHSNAVLQALDLSGLHHYFDESGAVHAPRG